MARRHRPGTGLVESHNTAVGDSAYAYGDGSINTANGTYSDAHGDGSDNSAFGSLAKAWGAGSSNTATGDQFGCQRRQQQQRCLQVLRRMLPAPTAPTWRLAQGRLRRGEEWTNTAVGAGAIAQGANSSAFGAGAIATLDNQQMFGTPLNTYTLAGINTQASKNAQTGDTYLVTSDASGNLATTSLPLGSQIDSLGGQIKTVGALSAALAGLHPNSRATGDNQLSGAVGSYNGQIGAAVGYYRNFGSNALVSVGAATSNGDTMTNAGVTLSW